MTSGTGGAKKSLAAVELVTRGNVLNAGPLSLSLFDADSAAAAAKRSEAEGPSAK